MINYALSWKKQTNFKQLEYDDFLSKFKDKHMTFSLKVDGQLAALVYSKGGDCYIQSTTGTRIEGISLTYEYKKLLDSLDDIESIVIVGELAAVKNGKLQEFSQSESIIKTYSRGDNASLIYHFVYDIYELNGHKITFQSSLKVLKNILKFKQTRIILLKQLYGGLDKFEEVWNSVHNSSGIEGVVARDSSGKAFKIKTVLTFDLAVMGCGNPDMISWERQQISYLIVAFVDDEGNFRFSSKVGSGFTFEDRKMFYNYCMKNKVDELPNGDILIKPNLVIEVLSNDLFDNNMKCYSYKNGVYINIGKKKSTTLRHPRYIRIRGDKSPISSDCGFYQIPIRK